MGDKDKKILKIALIILSLILAGYSLYSYNLRRNLEIQKQELITKSTKKLDEKLKELEKNAGLIDSKYELKALNEYQKIDLDENISERNAYTFWVKNIIQTDVFRPRKMPKDLEKLISIEARDGNEIIVLEFNIKSSRIETVKLDDVINLNIMYSGQVHPSLLLSENQADLSLNENPSIEPGEYLKVFAVFEINSKILEEEDIKIEINNLINKKSYLLENKVADIKKGS